MWEESAGLGNACPLSISEDGVFARNDGTGGYAWVVGSKAVGGNAEWIVKLDNSQDDDAAGVCVGVADATGEGSAAWALACYDGDLWHIKDYRSDSGGETLVPGFVAGFSKSGATGSEIRIRADLGQHSLKFAVNGGDFKDAGVLITDAVRPYALLYFKGDQVSFTGPDRVLTCRYADGSVDTVVCTNLAGLDVACFVLAADANVSVLRQSILGQLPGAGLRLLTADGRLLNDGDIVSEVLST